MIQSKKPDNTKPVDTSERMPFQDVDNVFCALHDAFVGETNDVDQRFLGLWYSFLSIANWTEDEYFEALEIADQGTCPDCGGDINHGDEPSDEDAKDNVVSLPTKKSDLN